VIVNTVRRRHRHRGRQLPPPRSRDWQEGPPRQEGRLTLEPGRRRAFTRISETNAQVYPAQISAVSPVRQQPAARSPRARRSAPPCARASPRTARRWAR